MRHWLIHIFCHDNGKTSEIGAPVHADTFTVLARVAAYQERLPPGWEVIAEPLITNPERM